MGMRTIVVAGVALVLGLSGGALAVRARLGPRVDVDVVAGERDAARKDLAKAVADRDAAVEETRLAEADNMAYREQARALREQVRSLQREVRLLDRERSPVTAPGPDEEGAAETPEPGRPTLQAPEQTGTAEAEEGPGTEDEPERAERRRAFREDMEAWLDGFFDQAMSSATDRRGQERIAAIQEHVAYLRELRDAMRSAQGDAEREVLRDSMTETGAVVRDLVSAQQDAMLRDLAAEFGIKDAAGQEAFVQSVRTLQDSPFFRMQGFVGRGPGGGGPGGSWGRSRRER